MRISLTALLFMLAIGCSDSHVRDDAGMSIDSGSTPIDSSISPIDSSVSSGCDGPSQCVLRAASCCGRCGAPTPEDMIAIPRTSEAAYVDMVCEGGTIGCPECASPYDPYLVATCREGDCAAVDLHVDVRTECSVASDCALAPVECCACGLLGVDQVVAFNPANGSIGSLVCDPDADCPPCVPDFGSMAATCEAGRCVVIAPGG